MKCKSCGRGRPKLWVEGKGFCDEECHELYKKHMAHYKALRDQHSEVSEP